MDGKRKRRRDSFLTARWAASRAESLGQSCPGGAQTSMSFLSLLTRTSAGRPESRSCLGKRASTRRGRGADTLLRQRPSPCRAGPRLALSAPSSTLLHESWTCLPPGSCMRRVATSSAALSRHCLMVSLRTPLATAAQSLPCRATARLSATSATLLHESWTCLPPGPRRRRGRRGAGLHGPHEPRKRERREASGTGSGPRNSGPARRDRAAQGRRPSASTERAGDRPSRSAVARGGPPQRRDAHAPGRWRQQHRAVACGCPPQQRDAHEPVCLCGAAISAIKARVRSRRPWTRPACCSTSIWARTVSQLKARGRSARGGTRHSRLEQKGL